MIDVFSVSVLRIVKGVDVHLTRLDKTSLRCMDVRLSRLERTSPRSAN